MEVGAHRRKHGKPTRQLELWKRAFWCVRFVELCAKGLSNATYQGPAMPRRVLERVVRPERHIVDRHVRDDDSDTFFVDAN